jgi:hypothetical protein
MRRVLWALAILGFSLTPAQAGWLGGGGKKLPKPIDSPIVRPKLKEDHKVAPHIRSERDKYNSPTWGANWKRLMKQRQRPLKPYLR